MHILRELTPHIESPLIEQVGMSSNVSGRAGVFLISGLVSACILQGSSLSWRPDERFSYCMYKFAEYPY